MLSYRDGGWIVVSLIATLASAQAARAAACCGGGLPVPALVLGDENANVSSTLTYSSIGTDVSSDGIWRHRQVSEIGQTLRIDTAHIVADRFQVGASLPFVRRSRADETSTGLGDIALNGGYEILPEWDYSPWRPRGVGFIQLVLPTGRSINEATLADQIDSRGRGFWALGAGFSLYKVRGPWDAIVLMEGHRSFAKEAPGTISGDLQLTPGWGGSVTLGAGRTFKDLRVGGSLAWIYEDATRVSGAVTSEGNLSRYASAAASLIYSPSLEWSASLSYSDQTLFGEPANTALARSVQVGYQRRWPR